MKIKHRENGMKTKNISLTAAAALLLALCACSDVKKELGIGRNSPDEFLVVKRAPLTLPPDYGLRPPGDGSVAPASAVSERAREMLMGEKETPAQTGTAETALLEKMGAQQANPDIRAIINKENGYIELQNRTLVDKLIFWKEGTEGEGEVPASVVNAKQESERLKKNQQEGKPVNDGDVPVIEKKRSTLDKIF